MGAGESESEGASFALGVPIEGAPARSSAGDSSSIGGAGSSLGERSSADPRARSESENESSPSGSGLESSCSKPSDAGACSTGFSAALPPSSWLSPSAAYAMLGMSPTASVTASSILNDAPPIRVIARPPSPFFPLVMPNLLTVSRKHMYPALLVQAASSSLTLRARSRSLRPRCIYP